MRIIAISDTHSKHDVIDVPAGDVLIHAGDLTMGGTKAEIFEGFAWLSKQPHERILFIPGNHDLGFQQVPYLVDVLRSKFPRIEVLIDQATIVHGLRVYGSPWQPWFHDWAYTFAPGPLGESQEREKWECIPDDTAILVTHAPVHGILDQALRGSHVGSAQLKKRVESLRNLRLHVCGHVHESYGAKTIEGIVYVNACCCDSQHQPRQRPIVIEVSERGAEIVHE